MTLAYEVNRARLKRELDLGAFTEREIDIGLFGNRNLKAIFGQSEKY